MTRCLAPDCQMGGLGCDNMTVILICNLNGQSYEKLSERCREQLSTHTTRSRSYSTGSSDSSCSTSCSTTTPELSENEDNSPKFQKKGELTSNNAKKTVAQVNINAIDELTEVKKKEATDEQQIK